MTPAWKSRLAGWKDDWDGIFWFFVGLNIACGTAEGVFMLAANTAVKQTSAVKIVTLVLGGAFTLVFAYDIFLEIAVSLSDSTFIQAVRKRNWKNRSCVFASWVTFIFSTVLYGLAWADWDWGKGATAMVLTVWLVNVAGHICSFCGSRATKEEGIAGAIELVPVGN